MDPTRPPQSLVERLNGTVDRARSIANRLGMSPWRVFIVRYKWTGGEVGAGEPRLEEHVELTPSPKVSGESGLRTTIKRGGTTVEGEVTLTEISPRYTEADLDLLFRDLRDDEEVFIEVVHDGRDGRAPERRAYAPAAKPERDVESFQWILPLRKQLDDRSRYGAREFWSRA